jgi:ABC-type sugar transport system permease subunit
MARKPISLLGRSWSRSSLAGYVYIAPWIIGTVLFFAYPVVKTFLVSCSQIVSFVGLKTQWVGLRNYLKIFTGDVAFIPNFLSVVRDTFVNVPLIVIFALFVAVLANKDIRGKGFFRGVFVLPFLLGSGAIFAQIVGVSVVGGVTKVAYGILIPKQVELYLGLTFANLVKGFLGRITLIILRSPIQVIVFLGALQTIPASSYESAKCDGATEWELFWKVTLPAIVPQVLFNTIFTLVESFTDMSNPVLANIMDTWFGDRYFMHGYTYQRDYSYIAAMGWVYLLFIILIAAIIFAAWGKANRNRENM